MIVKGRINKSEHASHALKKWIKLFRRNDLKRIMDSHDIIGQFYQVFDRDWLNIFIYSLHRKW